jgi:hypothetical protein
MRLLVIDIIRAMRRLVVLLFALILPLQFAWSAAAAYCQHETDAVASRHFGHHSHVHQGHGATSKSTEAGSAGGSGLSVDHDCGTCHASAPEIGARGTEGIGVPVSIRKLVFPSVLALASAPGRTADRPQWLRLA